MDMNIIQSAATEVLVNLSLAVISLAGAYAVYYIRLGASKLKAQTAQIEDESARQSARQRPCGRREHCDQVGRRDGADHGKSPSRRGQERGREPRGLACPGQTGLQRGQGAIAPEAQKVITDNLGSFDDYLTKCIEDAVLKVKQSDPFITLPEGVLLEGNTVTEEAAPSSKE